MPRLAQRLLVGREPGLFIGCDEIARARLARDRRIIDQRWREHLQEMDYLQEGINLRAMGQRDPLVEWQREGYEMFGEMMKSIAQDFVKYVMHVKVVDENEQVADDVIDVATSGPEDPSSAGGGMAAAARAQAVVDGANLTYYVNGQLVNAATDSTFTSGKIMIQSEGAEIFFRRFDLEPLR